MARLKFSISLENFKILNFFYLWALRVRGPNWGPFLCRRVPRND